MSAWKEFSYSELMSIQGIELDEVDADSCQDEVDADSCQVRINVCEYDECGCYGGCNRCLIG